MYLCLSLFQCRVLRVFVYFVSTIARLFLVSRRPFCGHGTLRQGTGDECKETRQTDRVTAVNGKGEVRARVYCARDYPASCLCDWLCTVFVAFLAAIVLFIINVLCPNGIRICFRRSLEYCWSVSLFTSTWLRCRCDAHRFGVYSVACNVSRARTFGIKVTWFILRYQLLASHAASHTRLLHCSAGSAMAHIESGSTPVQKVVIDWAQVMMEADDNVEEEVHSPLRVSWCISFVSFSVVQVCGFHTRGRSSKQLMSIFFCLTLLG